MTLFWELIIGVVHQPYQSKELDKDGRHAHQSLSHCFIVLLCLGDLYLREQVHGYENRELFFFSDKLCHLVRDFFRERCRNEEVEVFLLVGPNVGDGILRNPPPLDYSSGEVGILFCRDSNSVRFSDRVRKALQQFGHEGWEF